MRIFIKAQLEGYPETETEYAAMQGFQALGYKPVLFREERELYGTRPDDLIVAGISTVKRKMAEWGIPVPEYDYPEELSAYLGRKIWNDRLDNILSDRGRRPVFVKPFRDKVFTGFIFRDEKDIPRLREAAEDEPVL